MATQLWAWQNGTAGDDVIKAVAMGADGSSVLAGYINRNTTTEDLTTVWTAVKLDANGTVLWTWQDETEGDNTDLLEAAAMHQDGSVVMAGSSDDDFKVLKLDADGSLVWRFEDGTEFLDEANGIAMDDDGSVVVGGTTNWDWHIPNVGFWDMVAFKLDANGTLLWKWQDGSVERDLVAGVAMGDDGSVVLSGGSKGDLIDADASVISSSSSVAGDYNFVAIKLDSEGAEVWRWQDGPRGEDNQLVSVSMTKDGSFVLVGLSDGAWSGLASAGELDFVAVKLDADGNELWRWQDGTSGNDWLSAVTVQVDGTIVLGRSTTGDWTGSNADGYDFAVVALDADGEEVWRWQDGSEALEQWSGGDYVYGMSAGSDGRLILAGRTFGSYAETNLGGCDLVAVMLDTGAVGTPSPTTDPQSPAGPASPPAPTPTPSSSTSTNTPLAPTPSATPHSATQGASNVVPILAGVTSAVVGAALIALALCLRKRQVDKKKVTAQQVHPPVVGVDRVNGSPTVQHNPLSLSPQYLHAMAVAAAPATANVEGGIGDDVSAFPAALIGVLQRGAEPTTHARKDGGDGDGDGGGYPLANGDNELNPHAGKYGGGCGVASGTRKSEPTTHAHNGGGAGVGLREGCVEGSCSVEPALTTTTSTAKLSTQERDTLPPVLGGGGGAGAAFVADGPKPPKETGTSSSNDRRGSIGRHGLGRAVGEAALELAHNSQIPGVSEAATAVAILVNLVTDSRDVKNGAEASLRRCQSIVIMLQRGAKVLGKGGDTAGKVARAMMEDVHDATFDLVELIKTYQSKNRLSQLLLSSLFRRRQDEMGAAVDRAILGLQLGLHVQVGNDVSAVKQDVGAFKDDMHLYKGSMEEAQSKSSAEARRARRQRKLDRLEIPEDHVVITDELLGKGGFGEVYLADYNGRNAAAKVLHISNDLGKRGENHILGGSKGEQVTGQQEKSLRKAFLLELDAMIRLRSPYTVNVYGAITTMEDRLVLVMELLSGGDLRTLLCNCKHPLPDQQSRQIVGDICAGMAFLHGKETVHGDLKSANVLLDGAGRAKIGDFGTSRWTQHAMSTGLATFTTNSSKNTQMSLAWSAPEVLHVAGSTYASDVYSFGIVVWEVLSRELPWASVTHPRDIYIRVALNGLRPPMPDGAPTEIADVARACWVEGPGDRPTFSTMMESMKANRWNE